MNELVYAVLGLLGAIVIFLIKNERRQAYIETKFLTMVALPELIKANSERIVMVNEKTDLLTVKTDLMERQNAICIAALKRDILKLRRELNLPCE